MRFISLFSGIEAASAAWLPIGWECVAVAEIEPFPCAVLAHHYPDVRNLGDITQITKEQVEALGHIDAIVLGFPCQDVSIAGQRQGFKNADGTLTRSGLFFTALRIIEWSKARWTIGENVPGLFSSHEGRDFASVVGELSGTEINVPGDGWRTAGVALGPKGLVEWFVLDAQYTRVASHPRAVPQRRRRVFIVRDTGNWQGRPPIFLVPKSLRWNPPPRREAGKGPTGTLAARTKGGGGLGTDFDLGGGLTTAPMAYGGNNTSGPIDVATACQAHGGPHGRQDFGSETFIAQEAGDARTLLGKANSSHADDQETYVSHSLTGEGFDASEDGTGRGTPVVPVCYMADDYQKGTYEQADAARPLTTSADRTRSAPVVAFSCKDHGADAGEVAPTLRSMGHDGSHANGGGQIAVAFRAAGQDGFTPSDVSTPIAATDGGGAGAPCVAIQDGRSMSKSQNGCGFNDDGAGYTVDTTGAQAVALSVDETVNILGTAIQAGALRENPDSGPDGVGVRTDGAAYTIEARAEVQAVMTLAIRGRSDSHQIETREDGTANAILTPNGGRAGIGVGANCAHMAVRRLTPLECERLMGLPDNYTAIPFRGKPAKDGPRYKALGNSFAENCLRWIGQRIQEFHTL